MSKHPRPSTFARFGKGLTSRLQNQKIVRHLLTGCPGCESLASEIRFDYSAAFEGVQAGMEQAGIDLARERVQAPGLLRALADQPEERWSAATTAIAAIEADPVYRTWALCELLQDASQECAFHDPARCLDMARLGVEVAMRLDPGRYGETRVNDLAGRAWAVLGNAERVNSAYQAAERSFVQARRLLRAGTGDPLEEAWLLMLEASLLGCQRRLQDAFRRLNRVISIGRRLDDGALCGKARMFQGLLAGAETLPALVLLLKSAELEGILARLNQVLRIRESV
jgi:hypothetical protein